MAICSLDLAGGPYTYADLERLPEDERIHYELSYGTLVVTPAPTVRHQQVLGDLVAFLKLLLPARFVVLPEADLLLTENLVKRPDIQVVRSELATGRYVAGIPDLVVEILSPATRKIDLTEKRSVYEEAGIDAYWIVEPETPELTVLELRSGRYVEIQPDPAGRIAINVPVEASVDPAALGGRATA